MHPMIGVLLLSLQGELTHLNRYETAARQEIKAKNWRAAEAPINSLITKSRTMDKNNPSDRHAHYFYIDSIVCRDFCRAKNRYDALQALNSIKTDIANLKAEHDE